MNDKTKQKIEFDRQFLKVGERYAVGVDEVGRGPLAGPVVCCAVIIDLFSEDFLDGVDDSKKVSEKKRELLFDQLRDSVVDYCICEISPEKIDEINILEATKLCMKNCVEGLKKPFDVVLIDAMNIDIHTRKEIIVKGDAQSYAIGSASIIAKVYRDRLMVNHDKIYPEYSFAKNKGYGTKDHINAIKEIGSCPIHRKTFIKNFTAK
ncbi:MAG: ribonuclease HII [Clostridia bacterium]|nr:ribonuclease HII [Clostridia bacterium]